MPPKNVKHWELTDSDPANPEAVAIAYVEL